MSTTTHGQRQLAGRASKLRRAGARERADAVDADAAVQAGAVPAVVELLAARDIAARAGDGAGMAGEHAGRVNESIARVLTSAIHSYHVAMDSIGTFADPGGIVLALNVYRRAHSHVQLESASAITRIQAHTCPQTFLHILGSGRSNSRRLPRHSAKRRHT